MTPGVNFDEPQAMDRGGKTYYYHADHLGSIVALTDETGAVVQKYDYDSYGNLDPGTATIQQPYAYTGREWDSETGLYYYRARYYDPKAGRFIGKDPIDFAGGDVNLYRYTGNNPVNWVDPYGLMVPAAVTVIPPLAACLSNASCMRAVAAATGAAIGQALSDLWRHWNEGSSDQHSGAVDGEGKSCSSGELTPTGDKKVEPSTRKGSKGGSSVQEGYVDSQGRPVTKHTIFSPSGKPIHGPHFRPGGFK